MNNTCPSCDAVYAVTAKDVGRKIKCKKCGTALRVDDEGLVEDTPDSAASEAAEEGHEAVAPKSKKKRFSGAGAPKIGELLQKVGGVPTALFGFGVFLTIWFFFQQAISAPNGASDSRSKAAALRVKLDQDQEIRKAEADPPEQPEGGDAKANEDYQKAQTEYAKNLRSKMKEINKKYKKPLNEANDDFTLTQISNARGMWWDQYGLMFGFMFLAFGCIAYIRGDGNLVLRIVAGSILTLLFLVVFAKFSGCGRGP